MFLSRVLRSLASFVSRKSWTTFIRPNSWLNPFHCGANFIFEVHLLNHARVGIRKKSELNVIGFFLHRDTRVLLITLHGALLSPADETEGKCFADSS